MRVAQRLVIGRLPEQRVTGPRDRLDVIHLSGKRQLPCFVAVNTEGILDKTPDTFSIGARNLCGALTVGCPSGALDMVLR